MSVFLGIVGISLGACAYLSLGYLLARWSIAVHKKEDTESWSSFLLFPFSHYLNELKDKDTLKLDVKDSNDDFASWQDWYILGMCLGWPLKAARNVTSILVLLIPKLIKDYRSKPKTAKRARTKTAVETYANLMKELDQTVDGEQPLQEARQLMELRTHLDTRLKNLTVTLEKRAETVNRQLSEMHDLAQPVVLDTDERLYRMLANEYGDDQRTAPDDPAKVGTGD